MAVGLGELPQPCQLSVKSGQEKHIPRGTVHGSDKIRLVEFSLAANASLP